MKRVAIVGYGRFGRALGELVIGAGNELVVFDADEPLMIDERIEVVLVATPIDVMPSVFDAIASAFAARTERSARLPLVMDVGSVKIAPVRALERAFGGTAAHAVGAHPLFGPSSLATDRARVVVICGSEEPALRAAEGFWRELGCDPIRATAEEHDRVMARTQALAFFFARGIERAGLDQPAPFSPPSCRAVESWLAAVRDDAGHVYRSIQVDNPFAAGARGAVLGALTTLDAELASSAAAPASALDLAHSRLADARSAIDDLDRELVSLLARRAALADWATRAKGTVGAPRRDPARETELLEARRAWAAAAHLDSDAVADVFEAILRFSRAHQGVPAPG